MTTTARSLVVSSGVKKRPRSSGILHRPEVIRTGPIESARGASVMDVGFVRADPEGAGVADPWLSGTSTVKSAACTPGIWRMRSINCW